MMTLLNVFNSLYFMYKTNYLIATCSQFHQSLPVRPFPALQWTAATFLGSCASQVWTSSQKGPMRAKVGGW